MPTDKKISELPVATSINASDISVLVDSGTDYQYTFTLLLQFLTANLTTGAKISFGTVLPQNTTGNNGDVFVNTSAGSFAQKVSGVWTIVYTLPAANAADGTLVYGTGIPGSGTGKNLDSYINTLTGVFYEKSSGSWSQVFSMATGPQGPQGIQGTNGTNGINGNTLLYGNGNPSNGLGIDSNFYLNTANFSIFGPKASGIWPAGTSIIGPAGIAVQPALLSFSAGTVLPIVMSSFQTLYSDYGRFPQIEAIQVMSSGSFNYLPGLSVSTNEITSGLPDSLSINVDDDGTGHLTHDIILKISL